METNSETNSEEIVELLARLERLEERTGPRVDGGYGREVETTAPICPKHETNLALCGCGRKAGK